MPRTLDTATLNGAAKYYAGLFLQDAGPMDADWVLRQFHNFTFADEFEYMVAAIKGELGPRAVGRFDKRSADVFAPRSEAFFSELLAEKLAVDVEGRHIPGQIGTTQLGRRLVGTQLIEVEAPHSIKRRKALKLAGLDAGLRETIQKLAPAYWPIYAGELEERVACSNAADPLPDGTPGLPVGALNTRISNECAILGCDAIVDNLDEGTSNAVIQGRTGAQPADPDTAVTGTLLFTLACSDPAFGNAADDNPGAIATASAITDDSSADATDTLGYCRASSTNDGATPLDDHIDGEAGTSGADFNFNTLAIVAGATVSMTSWTVTMPET